MKLALILPATLGLALLTSACDDQTASKPDAGKTEQGAGTSSTPAPGGTPSSPPAPVEPPRTPDGATPPTGPGSSGGSGGTNGSPPTNPSR